MELDSDHRIPEAAGRTDGTTQIDSGFIRTIFLLLSLYYANIKGCSNMDNLHDLE